jgi:hypothetical protein
MPHNCLDTVAQLTHLLGDLSLSPCLKKNPVTITMFTRGEKRERQCSMQRDRSCWRWRAGVEGTIKRRPFSRALGTMTGTSNYG